MYYKSYEGRWHVTLLKEMLKTLKATPVTMEIKVVNYIRYKKIFYTLLKVIKSFNYWHCRPSLNKN